MSDVPAAPAAGWYPDPVTGTGHRYWNGFAWTDDHSMDPGGSGGGLQAIGEWLSEAFRLAGQQAKNLFPMVLVVSLISAAILVVTLYQGLGDLVIVIPEDGETVESLGEVVIGFTWADGLLLLGGFILSSLFSVVLSAAVARHIIFARTERAETWQESLLGGIRRAPRVFGVSMLIALGGCAATIPIFLAVVDPFFLLLVPFMMVFVVWLWVRLMFASTAAAVAPKGEFSLPLSFRLTSGLFAPLFGRALLLLAIVFSIQLTGSFVTAPFTSFSGPEVEEFSNRIEATELLGTGNLGLFIFVQLVSSLISAISLAIAGSAMAVLYLDLGGPLDDDFRSASL